MISLTVPPLPHPSPVPSGFNATLKYLKLNDRGNMSREVRKRVLSKGDSGVSNQWVGKKTGRGGHGRFNVLHVQWGVSRQLGCWGESQWADHRELTDRELCLCGALGWHAKFSQRVGVGWGDIRRWRIQASSTISRSFLLKVKVVATGAYIGCIEGFFFKDGWCEGKRDLVTRRPLWGRSERGRFVRAASWGRWRCVCWAHVGELAWKGIGCLLLWDTNKDRIWGYRQDGSLVRWEYEPLEVWLPLCSQTPLRRVISWEVRGRAWEIWRERKTWTAHLGEWESGFLWAG